jgi:hypothetical protein
MRNKLHRDLAPVMEGWRRLQQIASAIKRDDLTSDEQKLPKALREALTEHIREKEAELFTLTDYEAQVSDIEAMVASFQGGLDSNDSETEGDQQ